MAGFDVYQPWQPTAEQPTDWESSGNVSLDNLIRQRQKGNIRQRTGRLATFMRAMRLLGIIGQEDADKNEFTTGFGGLTGQ